jgi:type IV secretion system protein VirB11
MYVERAAGWERVSDPQLSQQWCRHLVQLVATATHQRINAQSPLLSAGLPNGERLQAVIPPASQSVVVTIRKPSVVNWSLAELKEQGFFSHVDSPNALQSVNHLEQHYRQAHWQAFLKTAVQSRLNILVAGATGSGKTTLTKALMSEIDTTERLVSIEDTPELDLSRHANSVRLLYSKDGQGVAPITPKHLLEASLRLRPDRIMLAELRGEEAYYYCRNISSGHAGSITSIHAGSPATAFIQLAFLIKESGPGREMSTRDIQRMLKATIDLVVICERHRGMRRIKTVWWQSQRKKPSDHTPKP